MPNKKSPKQPIYDAFQAKLRNSIDYAESDAIDKCAELNNPKMEDCNTDIRVLADQMKNALGNLPAFIKKNFNLD
jgi:hypothetical protein